MNITNPHSNLTPQPRVSHSVVRVGFGITIAKKLREEAPKSYDGIPECHYTYFLDLNRLV